MARPVFEAGRGGIMGEKSQTPVFFWICCLLLVSGTLACSKKMENKTPPVEKPLYLVRDADGFLGYVDRTGRYVIKPWFTRAGNFHDGVAQVNLGYRWWFIDEEGYTVSEDRLPASMIARPSQEELKPASRDGKCGYIDKTGEFVVKPQFGSCQLFHEGLAAVVLADKWDPNSRTYIRGKWGFIDQTGKFVIKQQFYRVDEGFSEGLAAVEVIIVEVPLDNNATYTKTRWGYIDKTGKVVIKPRFGHASEFREGLAVVQLDQWDPNNLCFIDRTGRRIGNKSFRTVHEFREGLAAVAYSVEDISRFWWGFIDKTGEFVIAPQYDEVLADFHEGLAVVRDLLRSRLIDKTGRVVAEPHW